MHRGFWSSVGFAPFYLMHLSRQQACVPLRLVTQVAELMCIQRFGIWGHRLFIAFRVSFAATVFHKIKVPVNAFFCVDRTIGISSMVHMQFDLYV